MLPDSAPPRHTARAKIKGFEELKSICEAAERERRRVVFTNGCFDILHVGHVRYLEEARNLGDLLVVAVNSDSSVRRIKGVLRPLLPQEERIELVASLQCVDYAVLFDTPDPLPLIEFLNPDVLVKGADWAPDKIVGADRVLQGGGRVARIALVPHISTSIIIERVLKRFCDNRTAVKSGE
jgi:D-beta-D-heptose 7-phosphate kinase/D-beta-D-heptose 1-phosphate adenosyltransferase